MAVKNYYSFGGEILAEETDGVRRDYLTDALGSVTATVTEAGTVENTYRYKPYGETLAKTGAGSDPKFLWVGKWGYRKMVPKYSELYVRHRHFSSEIGLWTSKDIFYLMSVPHAMYKYSSNSPSFRKDPLGLQDDKDYGFNCTTRLWMMVIGYKWWRENMIGAGPWQDLLDDWFFEREAPTRKFYGKRDPRNNEIRHNVGFRKMLDCWAQIYGGGCALPRNPGGGSSISPGGFQWHYALKQDTAPGGEEAYTPAIYFLGSYTASITPSKKLSGDKCKIIVNINVMNKSGWKSATRLPKYGYHFPDVKRGTLPCAVSIGMESIGGDMWQNYYWEEEVDICNNSCELPERKGK